MQVILQQDVRDLGNAGDIVSVKNGYGRNFLIPKKIAVMADPKNIKELEHFKKVVVSKQLKAKKEAEVLAAKIAELSITVAREVGEEDKIFGSVTTKDIADTVRGEGFIIDRHDIKLEAPIKKLGIFDIKIKLHSEVEGVLKVWVVKK